MFFCRQDVEKSKQSFKHKKSQNNFRNTTQPSTPRQIPTIHQETKSTVRSSVRLNTTALKQSIKQVNTFGKPKGLKDWL